MSSPDDSWNILKEMNADYVVIFFCSKNIGKFDDKLYVLNWWWWR